jgi:aminoglycoside 3-N-acetyltransferase
VTRAPDYDGAAIVRALREVGLRAGDVVFCHSSVAMLGIPAEGLDEAAIGAVYAAAFREVLGPEGTLVLPAFTYSYTKGEVYDPAATPPAPAIGALPIALWRHPAAARSLDPLFSVIALGGRARELAERAGAEDSFGAGSIYALLLALDAAILNIGLRGTHAQLAHHVEQQAGVSYRFIKRFRGTTVVDGAARETEVAYNVRALDEPRHFPSVKRIFDDAAAQGALRSARLGRGEINAMRAREVERLVLEGLARDPDYLVVGDA